MSLIQIGKTGIIIYNGLFLRGHTKHTALMDCGFMWATSPLTWFTPLIVTHGIVAIGLEGGKYGGYAIYGQPLLCFI